MAVRGLRRRRHRARGGDRRPGAGRPGRRRPPGHRPRRQGAHRGPAEPRVRHRDRRLPAGPGSPRLPARRARRGARDRRQRRRRPRHHRRPDPRAGQPAAPADPGARPAAACSTRSSSRSSASCRETEKAGIRLDTSQLETVATRIRADVAQLERDIWELAGEEFMIGSPQQLGVVLFDKLQLSRKRRGKTGYSTDARVLQAIRDEHEIIPKIERYRELSKLEQTYLTALPNWIGDDGRLHTTFEQTTAATGRLCSINPNLQNIPIRTETGREIRACFIPEPGNVLLSVDYSPGRAARPRPHRQRAGAARHLRPRRGRPHRDRERRLRAPARAARRRHALQGQDGQLRDRLRPVRLRPRRPPPDPRRRRRRSSSTATSRASRPSPSS